MKGLFKTGLFKGRLFLPGEFAGVGVVPPPTTAPQVAVFGPGVRKKVDDSRDRRRKRRQRQDEEIATLLMQMDV